MNRSRTLHRFIPVTLMATMLMSFQICIGQFKNTKLAESPEDQNHVGAPAIAINPRDPMNIVAASAPGNLYTSKDGGSSWTNVKASDSFGHTAPVLVTDHKGSFYFFFSSGSAPGNDHDASSKPDKIMMQSSSDGGITWSKGEMFGMNPPKHQDQVKAAVDLKGNFYVTWTQYDNLGDIDSNCLSHVMFSSSKNGKKWTTPTQLSQTPGNCINDDQTTLSGAPAVSADGRLYVAWSNQKKLFFDRSFDGGNFWLYNDIVVAEQRSGSEITIPGHQHISETPVTAVNNSKTIYRGHVYILWADQKIDSTDTDIFLIRTANSGDNWTQPIKVNTDKSGKHQYLPAMAIDQVTGFLYVVFYDRRDSDDNSTEVYLAFSTDNGSTFQNVKISESAFLPDQKSSVACNTNIAANNGVITTIWTRVDGSKSSVWTCVLDHDSLVKAVKK